MNLLFSSLRSRRLMASILLGALAASGAIAARPPDVEIEHDLVFAIKGGERLTLDVYRPHSRAPHPVIILVHGGSWKGGDKSNWRTLAPEFAAAGFLAFSVNYRLTSGPDGVHHPAPVRDVETALAWILEHAAGFDGDPTRAAMIGSSAGAHLTMLVGSRTPSLDAIAVLSPPALLRPLARGPLGPAVRDYLGCSPTACPQRYRRASPLRRITPAMPPVFLAYSTDELIPRVHGDALARKLAARGVHSRVRVLAGERHGLNLGRPVLDDLLGFLTRRLD